MNLNKYYRIIGLELAEQRLDPCSYVKALQTCNSESDAYFAAEYSRLRMESFMNSSMKRKAYWLAQDTSNIIEQQSEPNEKWLRGVLTFFTMIGFLGGSIAYMMRHELMNGQYLLAMALAIVTLVLSPYVAADTKWFKSTGLHINSTINAFVYVAAMFSLSQTMLCLLANK